MTADHDHTGGKPYGRDAVRQSLLVAAAELFAARGPDAVAVRDIAERAHVNHALLHRHFGTKEALIQELLDQAAVEFREIAENASPATAVAEMFHAMVERDWFWKMLAYALLSGRDASQLHSDHGAIGAVLHRAHPDDTPALEERAQVAANTAFIMGWLLFEPFVTRNALIGDDEVEPARQLVVEMLTDLTRQTRRKVRAKQKGRQIAGS